jgi:quinol monooxygenase YgiN
MIANFHLGLVACVIDMHFLPHNVEQAIQLLVSTIGSTEAKPECRECVVARDASDDLRIRYSEAWDSESAFRRHLQSSEFRRVLTAMDMCQEEPGVTIGSLSGRSGMAYLQELRETHDRKEE